MLSSLENHRTNLLAGFNNALQAVNGHLRVRAYLDTYPLQGDIYLIAIGKAAASMTDGAVQSLGQRIGSSLVITKHGHGKDWSESGLKTSTRIICLEAGHPLPDARSLHAGNVLLNFIDTAPDDARFLFLISGGASALVEVPVTRINLAELIKVNEWLLGAGLDIHQMNSVRKKFSAIKGGRLAQRLNGRAALNLLVSDVPGNDPGVIGSGLLIAQTENDSPGFALPDWINALMKDIPAVPEPDAAHFKYIRTQIVASLADAMQGAASHAHDKGYQVHLHEKIVCGDAIEAGHSLAGQLLAGEPGFHIWGGETTVHLPPYPGRGGRNQILALAAAQTIRNHSNVLFLAAGTDGTDGPTADAGAIVDGATLMRGECADLDAVQHLLAADAGNFLEASGDLIHTGPTGTNVMDLVLGVKF